MRPAAALLPLLVAPAFLLAQGTPDSAAKAAKKALPLEEARRVSVSTTRGSWISLDVSPDGRQLVFDLLGDLYLLPIEGGRATRLTQGLAYDAQPRFSPDGRRIAFVSDRSGGDNVWTIRVDGTDSVQVSKGNDNLVVSPEWTPDGRYLVASVGGGLGRGHKLWQYDVEGGSGIQLVGEPAPLKMLGAAFGPDPRYLWYAQRTGDWQYNAILPQYQLGVLDRETGERTVMSNRYGSAFRPALSPDGKWLVYGSRHAAETGLRLRELATGTERWLAYPVQRDEQESRAPADVYPGYSFTPDAKAIVVSYGGEIWRVPLDGAAPAKIPFTVDADVAVGPEVRFTYPVDDAPTFLAHQVRDAVPSPDGKRLAFTALDKLYVMDWPGGTPRRLTDLAVGEYQPTWSPDGRAVAFVTWDDRAGGHIWRVAVDAKSRPQQLTRAAAYYQDPAWAPDGRRIAAVRAAARDLQEASGFFQGGLGSEFVWVPAAGGEVTRIAPAAGRGRPHFTRDTTRIYAYGPRDGLVSFRWDGTDVKPLLKVSGPKPPGAISDDHAPGSYAVDLRDTHPVEGDTSPPPPAAVVLLSPTGEQALALVGSDLYAMRVPPPGGRGTNVSVANLANTSIPVRKLSDVGAQFPAWSADGQRVHWSIGRAHAVYDLARARAVEDSVKAARAAGAKPDSAAKGPAYQATETEIAVRVTRALPTGTMVLRGARVITMKGDEVIDDADVVVEGHRVRAVGRRGSVDVPASAAVVDVSGRTIVPGFVDTHYHAQWLVNGIHTRQVWQYLATLAYGVTTTRDPQTATTDVLTYGDRVEAGEMVGPRVYSTGPGVFAGELIRDQDHARSVLKRYSRYWDTKTLKMYMSGNRQQRQWIITAARELQLMPTTEGGLDWKLNVTHALDGYPGIEHALPITPIYDDIVTLFARTQVANSPTLLVSYGGPWAENFFYATEEVYDDARLRRFTPLTELEAKTRRRGGSPGPGGWFRRDEHVFPRHARFVKDLVGAGGIMGVGSHGQLQGLGFHWELWAMASGGLGNHEALRVATLLGARAIGMETDLGSIEPGKLADLVVLDGDPLRDLRQTAAIRYVMKGGRLHDGATLDEVWPAARPLPAQWWRDTGPSGVPAGIR